MSTTKTIWQQLAEEFPAEWERTYQGRGGRSFTYIEPRDVMERLDTVLTPAGWQFEAHAVGDTVAHGRLTIWDGEHWIAREDFGYPNNAADIAESLKEAQSDALRRCAMMFGVARYLYRRDTPHAAPQRPVPTQKPAPSNDEPPWPADTIDPIAAAQSIFAGEFDESKCPDHDKPFKSGAKGWYCATPVEKQGGSVSKWCTRKPSKAWAAAQELIPA